MAEPRTGAERYLDEQLEDPEYREAYERARRRTDQFDRVREALNQRREELALTKAELARRADVAPEAVRRLFTVSHCNPTLRTLAALADAMDLELVVRPTSEPRSLPAFSDARAAASETRRRTA